MYIWGHSWVVGVSEAVTNLGHEAATGALGPPCVSQSASEYQNTRTQPNIKTQGHSRISKHKDTTEYQNTRTHPNIKTQTHNTIVQLPPQVIDLIFNLFLFPRFLSPFALVWGVPLLFSCFQFLWQLCFLVPLLGFVPPLFATWQLFREPCRIFSMGCRGPIWQRVFNGSFRLYFEFVFLLLSTAVSLVSCVYKCVSYESHRVLILECRFWNTCLCDSVSWMCPSVLNRCRLPRIPIV